VRVALGGHPAPGDDRLGRDMLARRVDLGCRDRWPCRGGESAMFVEIRLRGGLRGLELDGGLGLVALVPGVASLQPLVGRLTRGRWPVAGLAERVGARRIAAGGGFRTLSMQFRSLGIAKGRRGC
jgi:hypothetical protein